MADNLSILQRQKNMQAIRSKGTSIERIVRSFLRRAHIKYKGNVKTILGKPDFVFPEAKVVLFLDSCFWHSCPIHATIPQSNIGYWIPKLARNKARDKYVTRELKKSGWTVIRIWEHRIKNRPEECLSKLTSVINSKRKPGKLEKL